MTNKSVKIKNTIDKNLSISALNAPTKPIINIVYKNDIKKFILVFLSLPGLIIK